MSAADPNKLNRIEELKEKLFSQNYEVREHRDSFSKIPAKEVPESWPGDQRAESNLKHMPRIFFKASFFKKLFIFSIGFFVLASLYASYTFFIKGNTVSNENIDISILGNNFTEGGEELTLLIGVINKNNSSLELVDLLVEYPKSTQGTAQGLAETERLRESLGTIATGGLRNENVKLVLFGQQGSTLPVKISIEYRVQGSNAIFVKEKLHQVSINSTPLNLELKAPTEISPNQDLALEVTATLNSTRPASKILVKLDYPAGFQFVSAKPDPSLSDNIWNLGDLAPGAERKISIVGKMVDVQDGEEKTFHISTGSQSERDKSMIGVVFNSLAHTVSIERPFIEARLYVGNVYQREYTARADDTTRAEIRWVNNADTAVNDLRITAHLSGPVLDEKSVKAERGFYNSGDDLITWDQTSISSFREVNPGDSGSVNFSFRSLDMFSTSGGKIISDPSITVEVSISGEQEIAGYADRDLKNSEKKIIKIISDLGFAAKGLYYSGPFKNTGSIPPEVEQETTYTISWNLSNTSNNISRASVRSTLPPWVDFVGPVSPTSEDLTYNSDTKEIIWKVGNIPKGSGLSGGSRGVSFQVSLMPSLSQLGTVPVLVNDAVLTGHDDFANVDIRVNRASVNTELGSDPEFPDNGGRVVE